MYNLSKGDRARLEFTLNMIETIEKIVERHGDLGQALQDYEAQNAIFMCLIQIGEKINKIENNFIKEKLPVKGAYGTRNIIVHDYDGVNLKVIKSIISQKLPDLKSTIVKLIPKS